MTPYVLIRIHMKSVYIVVEVFCKNYWPNIVGIVGIQRGRLLYKDRHSVTFSNTKLSGHKKLQMPTSSSSNKLAPFSCLHKVINFLTYIDFLSQSEFT